MNSKQARLVERGHNDINGGTYEVWDIGDGHGIYVDYNPCPFDTLSEETMAFPYDQTMAFPYDLNHKKVTSWEELDTWFYDATGGEAMRDLGYEPVEEAHNGER